MAAQVKNDLDALGFDVTIQTDTSPATYAAIDGGEAYDILLAPGDPSCFGCRPRPAAQLVVRRQRLDADPLPVEGVR